MSLTRPASNRRSAARVEPLECRVTPTVELWLAGLDFAPADDLFIGDVLPPTDLSVDPFPFGPAFADTIVLPDDTLEFFLVAPIDCGGDPMDIPPIDGIPLLPDLPPIDPFLPDPIIDILPYLPPEDLVPDLPPDILPYFPVDPFLPDPGFDFPPYDYYYPYIPYTPSAFDGSLAPFGDVGFLPFFPDGGFAPLEPNVAPIVGLAGNDMASVSLLVQGRTFADVRAADAPGFPSLAAAPVGGPGTVAVRSADAPTFAAGRLSTPPGALDKLPLEVVESPVGGHAAFPTEGTTPAPVLLTVGVRVETQALGGPAAVVALLATDLSGPSPSVSSTTPSVEVFSPLTAGAPRGVSEVGAADNLPAKSEDAAEVPPTAVMPDREESSLPALLGGAALTAGMLFAAAGVAEQRPPMRRGLPLPKTPPTV